MHSCARSLSFKNLHIAYYGCSSSFWGCLSESSDKMHKGPNIFEFGTRYLSIKCNAITCLESQRSATSLLLDAMPTFIIDVACACSLLDMLLAYNNSTCMRITRVDLIKLVRCQSLYPSMPRNCTKHYEWKKSSRMLTASVVSLSYKDIDSSNYRF